MTQRSQLARFDLVERLVHWSTAIMMLTLIVTGAILYLPALALRVGHRSLVENIHVITGLCLLGPLLLGIAGPWRQRLLTDLRRLDRWRASDFDWFRSRTRRSGLPRDKFNGGQKLEAAFLGAAMVAALVTGVIMRYAPSSWITWATGATLVHDALFFAIVIAVIAHIAFALSKPQQLHVQRPHLALVGEAARGGLAERSRRDKGRITHFTSVRN
jgi:formate dehydrogenase subunit gamma